MKLWKTGFLFLALGILVSLATPVLAVTDVSGDVYYYHSSEGKWLWEPYSGNKPNIDITDVSFSIEGSAVTLTMTVAGSIENIETITYYMYLVSTDTSDDFYQVVYINGLSIWEGFGKYIGESGSLVNPASDNILTATFNISDPTASYTTWGYTEELSTEGETAIAEMWSDYVPDSYAPYYIPNGTVANEPPVADLSAGEPYTGFVGVPIRFNGSLSNDSDGNITDWFWTFGDGNTSTLPNPTHQYTSAGNYTVTLTVTDDDGDTDSDTTIAVILGVIPVQNKPPLAPTIDGPTTGNKNVNYSYTIQSTDPDNDTIDRKSVV